MPRYRQAHRKSTSMRLPGYDYALAGGYFITFCTHDRRSLLAEITQHTLTLTQAGLIVDREIQQTSTVRPSIIIDSYVVMPDHVHLLLIIAEYTATRTTSGRFESPSRTVGAAVRGIKATATRGIIAAYPRIELPIWQSSYHDSIIREAESYYRIRRYIANNPGRWIERYNQKSKISRPEDQE